jgi:hypothetical protein
LNGPMLCLYPEYFHCIVVVVLNNFAKSCKWIGANDSLQRISFKRIGWCC